MIKLCIKNNNHSRIYCYIKNATNKIRISLIYPNIVNYEVLVVNDGSIDAGIKFLVRRSN